MTWSKRAAPAFGDDKPIEAFDADWTLTTTAAGQRVYAVGSTERLGSLTASAVTYRYTGTNSPTGDQLIRARIHTRSTAERGFSLVVRMSAVGAGYLVSWVPVTGVVSNRILGTSSVASLAATTGTVLANTTYEISLKVTGTNPCIITAADDVNGTLFAHEDSTAGRLTTGVPGIWFASSNFEYTTADPWWMDDIEIEDWSTGAGVNVLTEDFVQFAWTKLSPP
jgi:hypothetical protein